MRIRKPAQPATTLSYVERVNRAIDHIVTHWNKPLRLDRLARVACLSPFHFHRVFQGIVGETPADFIKRIRLERALAMMSHPRRQPLTRIALACGFSSSSDFSRSFRQRFGVPPSVFDARAWFEAQQRELLDLPTPPGRNHRLQRLPPGANPDGFRVVIRSLPPRTVAYIRVLNPYRSDAVLRALQRLMRWAQRHDCADNQWLGYQWEDPHVTALKDCIYHAAVECPGSALKHASGEIGQFRFPAMLIAEVEVRGSIDLEYRALQWLYSTWLPRSGYVPDDQPTFEAWIGRPNDFTSHDFALRIQLPIRRP